MPGNKPLPAAIDPAIINTNSCGPFSSGNIDTAFNGKFIVPLPGWGHYTYRISTDNDSAQFYFDQGLSMYYSYHMREARASFQEAARFDPGCPMTYWGLALAMGPAYNSAHTYGMPKGVPAVIQLMNQNAGKSGVKEKDLIEAMNRRYSASDDITPRVELNMVYARRMRELVTLYPDDQDIKTLYIDAMMLIHPWDFWNNDGSPKKWTPELVQLCENVLKENPNHPAALHYYIHLTEASRNTQSGLVHADVLKDLLPGVAHMVHMSSHEYQRNGLYAKGVEINDKADDNLLNYDSLANNLSLPKHITHYFAVQAYCGLSGGMYVKGMHDAIRCRNSITPTYDDPNEQYLYMLPVLTLVRLGKWKEILQDSLEPDSQLPYAGLLYNFAKGMALLYNGNADSAAKHLDQLRMKAKDSILTIRRVPFNTPLQSARIAEGILNASILFSRKKYDRAISSLTNTIRIEDSLIYCEPKDWPLPARQFLGAYLLKLRKPASAEKVYREDLIWNPGNGWSLLGLCQSLKAQKKTKNLAEYRLKYLQSFSKADRIPPGSVYMK